MSISLPHFENHAATLRISSVISILTHGVLLAALAWTFPYPSVLPPKDEGIAIELDQIVPPEPPVEKASPPPPPPVAEAEPPREEPVPAPEPAPQKIEKPKPAKPKPTPPRAQPVKSPAKTVAHANTAQTIAKPAKEQSKPATPSAPVKDPANPRPAYPELARKRNQEGVARVRCQVNAAGQVTDASIAQSSGHKLLDDAALKTVRKWRFKPAMSNGAAVAGSVVVPVEFRLR